VLENLSTAASYSHASRHVIICVSGFLSAVGDMDASWRYLVDECRSKEVPLYTVRWEAKDQTIIENMAINQAKSHLAPVLSNTSKFSDLFSSKNLANIGGFIGGFVDNGAKHFREARSNAKMTGKLLAHFLSLGKD